MTEKSTSIVSQSKISSGVLQSPTRVKTVTNPSFTNEIAGIGDDRVDGAGSPRVRRKTITTESGKKKVVTEKEMKAMMNGGMSTGRAKYSERK